MIQLPVLTLRIVPRRPVEEIASRVLEVLVEGPHEETDLVLKGRHRGQAPEVDGNVLVVGGEARIGAIQPVRITEAHAYDLVGEVVEGRA